MQQLFQVDNPCVLQAITKVQKSLIEMKPQFQTSMVPIEKAHITLLALRAEENERERSKEIFCRITKEWNIKENFNVKFKGLDTFDDSVLFMKPVTGQETLKLMNRNLLREAINQK